MGKDHGKMPTGKKVTKNCNWKIRQRKNDRVGKKGNVKLASRRAGNSFLRYKNNAIVTAFVYVFAVTRVCGV